MYCTKESANEAFTCYESRCTPRGIVSLWQVQHGVFKRCRTNDEYRQCLVGKLAGFQSTSLIRCSKTPAKSDPGNSRPTPDDEGVVPALPTRIG